MLMRFIISEQKYMAWNWVDVIHQLRYMRIYYAPHDPTSLHKAHVASICIVELVALDGVRESSFHLISASSVKPEPELSVQLRTCCRKCCLVSTHQPPLSSDFIYECIWKERTDHNKKNAERTFPGK